MTNYKDMSPGMMLEAVEDDAVKWAAAFCQIVPNGPSEDLMIGWFANAIEQSHSVRVSRQIHSDEAFADHCENVLMQRRFLRELRLQDKAA